MSYSEKFVEAVAFALQVHDGQRRKGSEVPYATHLFAVAAMVGESGGSEDEVIAALLHDAAEDHGPEVLVQVRGRFGDDVAAIVEGCSDALGEPKPPWRARKEAWLERLARAGRSVLLVATADKLHNIRCTLQDLREHGDGTWERFKAGRDGTLWYYRALLALVEERLDLPLVRDLSQAVHDLAHFGEERARLHPLPE